MRNAELTARLVLITVCLIVLGIPVGLYVSGQREVLHARLAENGGWSRQVIQAEAGQPLHLRMTSDDVMHSFAVGQSDAPAVDIEPGKISEVTLTFDKPGIYTFYCTRWCGLNHWRMRGTIEVSGSGQAAESAGEPLYARLGLDIDAPHPAQTIPLEVPSAAEGRRIIDANPDLARFLSGDYYRSHSPAQAFADLDGNSLTDAQKWDVVAEAWRSNASPEALEEGRKLFAQNCAACHGETAGGDGVFADDLAAAGEASMQSMEGVQSMSMQAPAHLSDPERLLGASPALLQGKILRGGMGTGMPMWGPIFTGEQTWNLVAYLFSLHFHY